LKNGKKIKSDLVILGTGIRPNTELATQHDDLKINRRNYGIEVNAFLAVNKFPNVFVAGDCASYPYWVNGQHIRTEHYNNAIK